MLYNPFTLENKTILITGASSGIGRATAIECSKMGAKIIVCGRDEARTNETLSMLEGEGHQTIISDFSNSENIAQFVSSLPKIDGCVNNAGFNVTQLVPFIKEESMKQIFNVNTFAPMLITHYLIKEKIINKNGSIVFTSSISANGSGSCSPGNSLYSATKGAIISFMKHAALDLSSKKIRCNAVLPGMVDTPLKAEKIEVTEEQWQINIKKYPLGRLGNPEDVAWAIIYFLSDASVWATGSTLIIDGGRSLR